MTPESKKSSVKKTAVKSAAKKAVKSEAKTAARKTVKAVKPAVKKAVAAKAEKPAAKKAAAVKKAAVAKVDKPEAAKKSAKKATKKSAVAAEKKPAAKKAPVKKSAIKKAGKPEDAGSQLPAEDSAEQESAYHTQVEDALAFAETEADSKDAPDDGDDEEAEFETLKFAEAQSNPQRLQKILAQAGIASRRRAEEIITEGRVEVNGKVVSELGSKADPARDHIRVDGKLLQGAERLRYYVLNKPRGFVTTVSDPEGRPTVMKFFERAGGERVYPVGRLDYLSEGLLFVTNDGQLAHRLTRAASGVEKVYLVKVSGEPGEAELTRLREGVLIERGKQGSGGKRVRTAPAKIAKVREGDNPWFEVVLIEGRNRELRKMFEEIGHHVEKIRRVGYGPLVLDVEPGKFRELTLREVEALRATAEGRMKPKHQKIVLPKLVVNKNLPAKIAGKAQADEATGESFTTKGFNESRPARPSGDLRERRPGSGRSGFDRSGSANRSGEDRPRRSFADRPKFGERRDSGDRPKFGNRPPSGDRPSFGTRGTSGDRPKFGDKPKFGDRPPSSDRPKFGARPPSGDRPSYGDRPKTGEGFQKRPKFGDRPQSSDRPKFGARPPSSDRRSYGDRKPFDRAASSDRPKSFDRKPFRDKPAFSPRPKWDSDDRPKGDFAPRDKFGDKPKFGKSQDRPGRFGGAADRKPFSSRPKNEYVERPEDFAPRKRLAIDPVAPVAPSENRPTSDRPRSSYGARPSFGGRSRPGSGGPRREYTPRPSGGGDRSGSDRPYSGRPRSGGDRPNGGGFKKPFGKPGGGRPGGKPFGKPGGSRPGGKPFGGRPGGSSGPKRPKF